MPGHTQSQMPINHNITSITGAISKQLVTFFQNHLQVILVVYFVFNNLHIY